MVGTEVASSEEFRLALQEIVDELAAILERPVVVRDAALSLRVTSTHVDGPSGTVQAPSGSDGADDHQLQVPVRGGEGVLGYLAVGGGGKPPIPRSQLDVLDAGAGLLRRALENGEAPPQSERLGVMADLLSDRISARKVAWATALTKRWLRPGHGTVVRALMTEAPATPLQCAALGRRLSAMRPTALYIAGWQDDVVFLVGAPGDPVADATVVEQAAAHGIQVVGMGTASPARGAEDLAAAATQAVAAAELSALLDELRPTAEASVIGGWLLVAWTTADPSDLKTISPAAYALRFDADDLRRSTVETYLDAGANVADACQRLFIHRTTLYYRLEKMPQVVKDALADGMKRSTLHLALKLVRLWEARGQM